MKACLGKYVLTSESKGGTNFPSLSSSGSVFKSLTDQTPHPGPQGLLLAAVSPNYSALKAKIAKFISAVLCESIRHDSGLFGEVTGLDVTERKGSNDITRLTCNSKAFVGASASFCKRHLSRKLVCVCV